MKPMQLVALVAVCLSVAQAAPAPTLLYRAIVLTQWNTTDATQLAKINAIEPKNVLPCNKFIVKGIMGPAMGLDGKAYYAKIYDFTSYDQYNTYKNCSNQAIYPQTSDWTASKTRIAFQITTATPIPKIGQWIFTATGNSTNPAATYKGLSTWVSSISCTFAPAYGAFLADAAFNAGLKAPVSNAVYASYVEGAGLTGLLGYLAGNAALGIPPPAVYTGLIKYNPPGTVVGAYQLYWKASVLIK